MPLFVSQLSCSLTILTTHDLTNYVVCGAAAAATGAIGFFLTDLPFLTDREMFAISFFFLYFHPFLLLGFGL